MVYVITGLLTACEQDQDIPLEFYSKSEFEKLVRLVGFII
jgi:hypothetical protein